MSAKTLNRVLVIAGEDVKMTGSQTALLTVLRKKTNGHILEAEGATVPTATSAGFSKGCTFRKTNGGVGTSLYVNQGSVTSCLFVATAMGTSGLVTSSSLTTAGLATAAITITDANIVATSIVLVSMALGTNSAGSPVIALVTPGTGSAVVSVYNAHATVALNGTLKLSYAVVA